MNIPRILQPLHNAYALHSCDSYTYDRGNNSGLAEFHATLNWFQYYLTQVTTPSIEIINNSCLSHQSNKPPTPEDKLFTQTYLEDWFPVLCPVIPMVTMLFIRDTQLGDFVSAGEYLSQVLFTHGPCLMLHKHTHHTQT